MNNKQLTTILFGLFLIAYIVFSTGSDPSPGPGPSPTPNDGGPVSIVVIYESSQKSKLTKEQRSIIDSIEFRNKVIPLCEKVNGHPELRFYDKDIPTTYAEEKWKKVITRTIEGPIWVVVSNCKTGGTEGVPDNWEQVVSLAEKWSK